MGCWGYIKAISLKDVCYETGSNQAGFEALFSFSDFVREQLYL